MKTDTGTESRRLAQNISEGRIHTLTSHNFGQLVLNGEGPIVVEFMSYGCAFCREIDPVLEEVAGIVQSQEKIFRVNIGAEQELAGRYEIHGTPTLSMFLNGQEVGRVEGTPPEISSLLKAVREPFELLK
jgi:thioredoxin 1